jgi:hypothetical protein
MAPIRSSGTLIATVLVQDERDDLSIGILDERQLRVNRAKKEFVLGLGKDLELWLSRQLDHQPILVMRDG